MIRKSGLSERSCSTKDLERDASALTPPQRDLHPVTRLAKSRSARRIRFTQDQEQRESGRLTPRRKPMPRTAPQFRADHVGSLLRQPVLKEARLKRERNEITAEALCDCPLDLAVFNREIERAIAKQEEIGLQL